VQACIGLGELSAHDDVNAGGGSARVGVRIFFPAANHFQRKQRAANCAKQHFAVGGVHGTQTLGIKGLGSRFKFFEDRDVLRNGSAGEVFQLRVIVVHTRVRGDCWIAREELVVQEIVYKQVPGSGGRCW